MTLIAYLVGTDAETELAPDEAGLNAVGSTDMYRLRTRDPLAYARLQVTADHFEREVRYDLDRFDILLNLVTDPDQNPRVLGNLARLVEGYRGRLLNPPDKVLRTTRDRVAIACAGLAHVVAPRTLRIVGKAADEAGDFPFPGILRLAGTHTGIVLGIVEDRDGLATLLQDGADHILTEFRDFRSADGLYRKYRFVFIGGEIVMRHLLVSDSWNVHAADRRRFMSPRPALIAEERALIDYGVQALPFPIRAGLSGIRDAVGLDLFGCDCALTDDGVLLFEANATMNFFPLADGPDYAHLRTALARAEAAFDALLFGGDGR